MTDEEKDKAFFKALFDEELEALVAAEEWRRTPEGLAEEARIEAEIEAHLKEMEVVDAEIAAYLKEKQNG